jgi:hypothetical protein
MLGTKATDTCNTNFINARLNRIEENLRHMMTAIQRDSRPQRYDRYAEDEDKNTEGQHLVHTLKATEVKHDYKGINSC